MTDTAVVPVQDEHSCEGGWVQVQPKYAEHLAAQVAPEGTPGYRLALAALLNSVYPCQVCRPAQFYRWAKGHWRPDHDMADCPDCAGIYGGKHAARRAEARHAPDPVVDQTRRDLQ